MAMAMGMARVFGAQVSRSSVGAVVGVTPVGMTSRESLFATSRRWASKKAGGSTKNGRDSESKRLGVKKFGGCVCRRLSYASIIACLSHGYCGMVQ
jgi:hypothetical protein